MEASLQIWAKFSQIFNAVNIHGYRESFPGGKAAGALIWPLNSIYCQG